MVPRTVLTRSGLISLNAARPVNTVQQRTTVNNAGPMKNVINNPYSTTKRPFNKITTTNNSNFNKRVNTVNDKNINAAMPNAVVNTARPKAVLSAVKRNKGNVVKASTYWVWRPKHKGILVRGLPSKLLKINQTCVACQKRKQHRASCKTKTVSSISQPLQMLHMDLFGLTFLKSLMKKMHCLVVTDDFSRFSWVFFLAVKDETSKILKTFITGIENLIDLRVKVIRCDNGTEFKNRVMNQFCEMKGIKREFSVARTPQQNRVAKRKNITLIETARTMLADSKLATTLWAESVNTTCYVQNRVLVIKPHNKTPYELFLGYSTNSKAFRVFNSRTRIVEENLHVQFSKNTPNIVGSETNKLFDIDALTKSMNYKLVVAGNQSNGNTGTKAYDNVLGNIVKYCWQITKYC
ncbi:putative ribonuclease H-like domain-containing protein [Tanacetum coccineum]